MKKRNILIMLAALCVLTGCSKIKNVEESTVTVDKDGIVTQVLIEEFSAKHYSKEDLENNIKNLVVEYNEETHTEQVFVKSFEVKREIAKVILSYQSDDDYRAFNQIDFFAGTVKQALEEEYAFAGDFVDAEGKDVKGQFVAEKTKLHAIIIREPLQVLVPGKILYVSRNMEIVSEDAARLPKEGDASYLNVATEAFGYVIYEED